MDIENHKYKLRLVSFYDEIVMDVVHVYFEREILDKDSLFIFLDRNAHILFHKYISTTPCCKCGQFSLAAPGKNNPLTQAQFNLLYDCNGDVQQGHEKKRNGKFDQHCLCKISPKSSVSVLDMDIILICTIIKVCCKCHSYPGNPQWLEEIKNIRNFVSHIGDSAFLSENDFNGKWKMLELSVLEISRITGPSYENSVKKRISSLKDQHKKMDNLTDAITMCNEISENKILEALRNFGVQIDNLSFQMKKAEFCSPDDSMTETSDSKKPYLQELEEEQSISCSKKRKCFVTWKFATPGHWDVKEMVKKLSNLSEILDFKVEFVYEGSLVVRTSTSICLLYDEKRFTTAISTFIHRLLEECEIDFSVKDEVEVDIIIEYDRKNDTEYISVRCPTCENNKSRLHEHEEEITRLKHDLNFQLERAYDTAKFEMSKIGLSSLEKSMSMDKPLDDLLANWENEEDTKYTEGSFREYSSIKTAFTATAEKEDLDKSLQSTESKEYDSAVYSLEDACNSAETLADKELKIPMFSKLCSFNINCEESITITGLTITSNNQIIISNVCTNRLLMFTETGLYMDDCLLIDNPWGVSVCSAKSNQPLNESSLNEFTDIGVVTLPDQFCYQYVKIYATGIVPDRAAYTDFRCMGIKLTDEKVLVGGSSAIHVFNRADEHLFAITTDDVVLQIEICATRHKKRKQMSSTDSREPHFKDDLIVLSRDDTLYYLENCIDTAGRPEESNVELSPYTWLLRGKSEQFTDDSLSGMAVGRHNEIYVSSKSFDSVYKFGSTAPTYFTRILDATQDIREPSAICFSDNCKKLFVATKDGRQIVIYRNNEYISV